MADSGSIIPGIPDNNFLDKGAIPHKPDLSLMRLMRMQSAGIDADEFCQCLRGNRKIACF